jgi:DNA repair exonuclease SbcCD ATPase subunit
MIYSASEVQDVLDELSQAAQDVTRMARDLGKAEAELTMFKAMDLADTKRAAQVAENTATMMAFGAGIIDGKNQAIRDEQLAAFLAIDEEVQAAADLLRQAEVTIANLEATLAGRTMDYKAATYRLHAARSKAELMRAMIDAGREPETESEFANEFGF